MAALCRKFEYPTRRAPWLACPVTSKKLQHARQKMTTTNRAFIKVYRHDGAEPTPAGLASAASRPSAVAPAATIDYVTNTTLSCLSSASFTSSIDVSGPPAQLTVDSIAS